MKRIFTFLLLAAALCALALPAAADIAYLPRDNFIEKHWDECSYMNRWFWTNGSDGYVLAHNTPDSKDATPLPNGGKYYISNVYQNKWGVLEYDPDTLENALVNGSVSGWVDMDEMVADYDNASFHADHASALRDETAELALDKARTLYCYKYPGSGEVTEEIADGWWDDGMVLNLSPLFTDPAGRTWGEIGYFYGIRNCWVCIDDPYNGALPPDENCVTVATSAQATPEPAETPAPAETSAPAGKTVALTPAADDATLQQAAKDNRGSGPYLAAGAGGVVVVAAAVLAAALRKKRK